PLGRRAGRRALRSERRADDDRPLARLRHLPGRRHRLPQPRRAPPAGRQLPDRGSRQSEWNLSEPKANRVGGDARERRRAPDRQVPPHLPRQMSATTAPAQKRLLTIGTVCRRLQSEFADISISKIRYLEDQGLL